MADAGANSFYENASTWISKGVEMIATAIQNNFINEPRVIDPQTPQEPEQTQTISTTYSDFRKIQLPETKTGLGSTESDLIVLIKKYLEIVGLVFFVWSLGYFHFSMSWILLAVFIYLLRQRQRNQFKLRYQMLNEIENHEAQYVKARLDELPSWVFFPDVERAEWLNRIIKQAWPYANQYLDKNIFRDMLVPMIQKTSSALSDFTFEKLDLGESPPRIGGIKVYSDNVRDQIMMDLEVFYAGDAIIKGKVKGIVCGIRNIQFVGDIRIILGPLINTIPLVGAVTYYFLRKPSISFKLTDAGTLVDIPGLNDIMLVQVNEILASMMVLPNRQVLQLVDHIDVAPLKWSNPQGVIRVFVLRAQNLIKADITLLGRGKSDPFVRVKVQGNVEYKTKTINNTTDPEWNEVFEFVVEQSESGVIQFEVYDEDPGKDDFIGRAEYPVNALVDGGPVQTWLTLQDVKKGSLNVSMQYFELTKQKSCIEIMNRVNEPMLKREKLSKALVACYIEQCKNLPASRKTRREPNPFCRIKVEGKERKTNCLESQTNPRFEHISQILCVNPLHEKLKIDVCDAKSNNETIAYFEMPIKQIYDTENMTIDIQTFPLKCLSEAFDGAKIVLRLSLYVLSPGRSSQSRKGSSPKSPSSASLKSFDVATTSATNAKSDLEQEKTERSTDQVTFTDDIDERSIASGFRVTSLVNPSPSPKKKSPGKKNAVLTQDPDLKAGNYGCIKIGIRYTAQRRCLSVNIYSCKNLIQVHETNLPDPYIRLCLIPDFKKDKRKTKSIHDVLNPIYDDLFEWQASLADVRRQHLFLSIKNNSPLFAHEQTYMGDLQIDLSNLDPERTSIAWYALQEPNTSAVGAIKIKYDTFESNE